MAEVTVCPQCLKGFSPKRSTAKFCSDACRVGYAKSLTSGNAKPVTLTPGGDPAVTLSKSVARRLAVQLNGLPRDPGVHAGHKIVPHEHTRLESGVRPCSGRWACESCVPADGPWTWFSGEPCGV